MMTQQSQQHEHEDDDTPAGFQIPDRLLSNSVKPLVFRDTYNTSTTQEAPTQLLSPSTDVEDAQRCH
eukprot:scaffold11255_cov155-Skeletonema_dohrnii-CCMP3373.AAC.1